MSYSMLVPRRAGRQRMAIRAAVMIANLMCKLKPARLERLMRLASRRTRAIDTELLEVYTQEYLQFYYSNTPNCAIPPFCR